jgi:hypothetical protein
MPLFFHDIYVFGDQDAAAVWRQEHQYEHTQFVTLFQGQPNPVDLPDYDLTSWQEDPAFRTMWLTAHESVHELLRDLTGVTGVNLADVDLTQEDEFYDWLDDHSTEHAEIRTALGIT